MNKIDNIYGLYYLDSNREKHIFYIGHSCNIYRRMVEHRSDGRKNHTLKGKFINTLDRNKIYWGYEILSTIENGQIVKNYEEWFVKQQIEAGHILTNMRMGDKTNFINYHNQKLKLYHNTGINNPDFRLEEDVNGIPIIENTLTGFAERSSLDRIITYVSSLIRNMIENQESYEVTYWFPQIPRFDGIDRFPIVKYKQLRVLICLNTIFISVNKSKELKIYRNDCFKENVGQLLLDTLVNESDILDFVKL